MEDFSRSTKAYILSVIFLGALVAAWQMSQLRIAEPWLLILAVAVSSLLQAQAVFGSTGRSSYSLSWMVYGYALIEFGLPGTLVVIFVSHLIEWFWARRRLTWYIQLFNMGNFVFAALAATLVLAVDLSAVGLNGFRIVVQVLAMIAFTVVNHLMVGYVIMLARGQSLAQSGVMGRFTLLLDIGMLCLGLITSLIAQVDSLAVVLIGFIAYLLYEALKVPALARKTETDPKTGLFNARYFAEALEEELERATRFQRPLSLIMADLDLLRNINNTYGHLAGDAVLEGVADTLKTFSRAYDIVARFGGEEFAILLPETNREVAITVAEEFRQAIADRDFVVTTSDAPIKATMSFGVASLEKTPMLPKELVHLADVALYAAKENGRNRCYAFAAELNTTVLASSPQALVNSLSATAARRVSTRNVTQSAPTTEPVTGDSNSVAEVSKNTAKGSDAAENKQSTGPLSTAVNGRVNGIIAVLIGASAILGYYLTIQGFSDLRWLETLLFAVIVVLVEVFSIEIYVKETTVSTSAAIFIVGAYLFGPIGVFIFGASIALVVFVKKTTNLQRFLFNTANHILGGLLVVALAAILVPNLPEDSLIILMLFCTLAALVLFVSTTLPLAAVLDATSDQSFSNIWNERFRWLALYYVGFGIVAASIIFSYNIAGLPGVFVIIFPLFTLRYSQKQYIKQTENVVARLRSANSELQEQSREISVLNEELLLTLAKSTDLRDPDVMEHSRNVARYAVYIAEELGMAPGQVEDIRKAGLLHDIGKLGVPETILFKPGRLTPEEYAIVKKHVDIGADLVRGCHSLHHLVPIIQYHHEWYNGEGYSRGLIGEEIPLQARIVGLADAIEAMASDRPYKKAYSPAAIIAEIRRFAGLQFDPKIVEAFVRVVEHHGEQIIVNSARNLQNRPHSQTNGR